MCLPSTASTKRGRLAFGRQPPFAASSVLALNNVLALIRAHACVSTQQLSGTLELTISSNRKFTEVHNRTQGTRGLFFLLELCWETPGEGVYSRVPKTCRPEPTMKGLFGQHLVLHGTALERNLKPDVEMHLQLAARSEACAGTRCLRTSGMRLVAPLLGQAVLRFV